MTLVYVLKCTMNIECDWFSKASIISKCKTTNACKNGRCLRFFKLFSMNYTKHVNMQIPPPKKIFPSGKKK